VELPEFRGHYSSLVLGKEREKCLRKIVVFAESTRT